MGMAALLFKLKLGNFVHCIFLYKIRIFVGIAAIDLYIAFFIVENLHLVGMTVLRLKLTLGNFVHSIFIGDNSHFYGDDSVANETEVRQLCTLHFYCRKFACLWLIFIVKNSHFFCFFVGMVVLRLKLKFQH